MTAKSNYLENQVIGGLFRSNGIAAWAASTAYSLGDRVYSTNSYGAVVFECTTAGTSDSTQPTWNTTLGATTTDNTVTWTCYHVGVLQRPIYVALSTADPGEDGSTIAEPSGGAYARVQVNPGDSNWSAPSDGLVDNSSVITFPTATASWGTIGYVALFDALTGGNMLYKGALQSTKAIGVDDTFKFNAGDLDASEA